MTATPTTPMLTKNTTELRILVQQHAAADQVIQGFYWDADEHRGCFIGCLNHSSSPARAEEHFGLPIMVQRIAENIFEALPAEKAKAFFAALPDAIGCDGKDLSRVGWQFLAAELRDLPAVSADIQAVIDPVIAGMDLLATGQEWPSADAARAADAAWAAARAAADAARAAAWAARHAAWAADAAWAASDSADAARAAAWAADAASDAARAARAARAAARLRQRHLLLRLIAEAPVVDGGAQ